MNDFAGLPDTAWLRVFNTASPLGREQAAGVGAALQDFTRSWRSHERSVRGAAALVHDRFLFVAADESAVPLSGCSKDSVVNAVRAIEAIAGMPIVDASPICFRRGAEIVAVSREEFAALAERGEVDEGTIVFDHVIGTVGEWRAGKWELPAGKSWHARAFDLRASKPVA